MTAATLPPREIGLVFDLNEGWMGGSYYMRNLIAALGMLPAAARPHLTLISGRPDSVTFARETGYPDLGWLTAEEFSADPARFPFDTLFPWAPPSEAARTLSWIPDFQELNLPFYCSPAEIANRRHHHRLRFATAGLVVSSQDVAQDVARFYPGECPNVAVVRFATFDRFDATRLPAMRVQYDLNEPYVMCANQVWAHKNHIIVLRAVALLKARGIAVTVAFTGSESDYRIGDYGGFLRAKAREWGVADRIRFLGFIPRDDQLNLMQGADYVLQPSLFEGWSTVVEDAKAMGQFVLASDLAVHREQIGATGRLFARQNPEALAAIMAEYAATPPRRPQGRDYDAARRQFGQDFMAAVRRFVPARPADAGAAMAPEEMRARSAENLATL